MKKLSSYFLQVNKNDRLSEDDGNSDMVSNNDCQNDKIFKQSTTVI